MKRLVLSFDGTWNTPGNESDKDSNTETNVCRLHKAVLAEDANGIRQIAWYDQGVGTDWYNRLAGGVAGVGLSRNIRQGYRCLAEHYDNGDEIFLFGFSRGAYTARSLAGLIRNCGILKNPDDALIHEAYQIYRTRGDGPDSEQAKAFSREFSHPGNVEIKCLGVWDTVGALGIPVQSFDFFNRHFYELHDVKLSSIVRNAFQALAIDENRREYEATVWDPSERPDQRIDQAWFPGAHSNVGGGYPNDILADVALAWMMERAESCGLALAPAKRPILGDQHWTQAIRDSFAEFMRGFYRFTNARYYRPIGTSQYGCEWLHKSAIERYRHLEYRPQNQLGSYLGCDAATPEALQELVGGKIWHLLQKLTAGRGEN
jgi:uncharacterized protein (DUF2235 family)